MPEIILLVSDLNKVLWGFQVVRAIIHSKIEMSGMFSVDLVRDPGNKVVHFGHEFAQL